MPLQVHTHGAQTLLAGDPATPLLVTPADTTALLEACFEHSARAVLLDAANLPPRFFDLSSGEAGDLLQKLRQYHIRLAVVRAPAAPLSAAFQALMREEQRGPDFCLFPDRAAATAWLLGP